MLLLLYVVVVYLISFCKNTMCNEAKTTSGLRVCCCQGKVPFMFRKIKANSKIMLTHTHTLMLPDSALFSMVSGQCFLIRKHFCLYRTIAAGQYTILLDNQTEGIIYFHLQCSVNDTEIQVYVLVISVYLPLLVDHFCWIIILFRKVGPASEGQLLLKLAGRIETRRAIPDKKRGLLKVQMLFCKN